MLTKEQKELLPLLRIQVKSSYIESTTPAYFDWKFQELCKGNIKVIKGKEQVIVFFFL